MRSAKLPTSAAWLDGEPECGVEIWAIGFKSASYNRAKTVVTKDEAKGGCCSGSRMEMEIRLKEISGTTMR